MRMNGLIDLFSKRFEQQSCLSPFFRLNDYFISFSNDQECVSIHLRKRSCQVIVNQDIRQGGIRLKGGLNAFQALLEGETKLTELIAQGRVETNGSYRMILKLETIFYLSSKQSRDAV